MNGKSIIERSADAWNNRDRDGFLALYAEDCEWVTPQEAGKGHQAITTFWDRNMATMPDNRVRIGLLLEEGEIVTEEAVVTGTNTGPIALPDGTELPASGNDVTIPFAAVHTIRGDKIVSSRFYWDANSVFAQLGLMPG